MSKKSYVSNNLSFSEKLKRDIKKYWPYYIMVVPGIVYLIVFKYIPMMGSIIAFQDYNVIGGIFNSEWVWLKHFRKLIEYPDFGRVFSNTVILGFYKTILIFPIPVILALMLNEVSNLRVKKSIQTAVYIPHFLSWVIVGGLVFNFFGIGGIYNNIRAVFDLEPILLMQKEAAFRPIYILSAIWKEAGWGTVVYMAAISGIDQSFYESASIDGASRFDKIRFITFPLLIPTILILFLLGIGSFMELGFDHVYNLLTPMTYSVGDVFDTYVYRVGIQQAQYSYTTAIGLFQSVIGLILVVTFNKISNKVSEGGLW